MADTSHHRRSVTRWLFAQSTAFGMMAALLGISANAMFLVAYGAEWLPATYVAIGVLGILVSGAVAAASRRGDLVRIATTVLGAGAALLAASWVVAVGFDGAWVSGPLLVAFPVMLQLGFVFIGSQAGRLLDLEGVKSSFPIIVAGFPVGAVIGGLLAPVVLAFADRAEHLLVAAALAQLAFVGLLLATRAEFPGRLEATAPTATVDETPEDVPRFRALMGQPLVIQLLAYQVWSAVGSQLSDYLVYDRAAARYGDGADLARFVSWYTAIMNIVAIALLAVVAGPLLRRFGLRLGIVANPAVLLACGVAMMATFSLAGVGSVALLAVVSFARIADIALTDGMTRTSINTSFQVLPPSERLTVQTAVEGVGVPVAIAATGALIIGLNALPFAVEAIVIATTVVCALWTWTSVRLYGRYRVSLVDAVRRRSLLDEVAFDADESEELAARRLFADADPRDLQVGLDLATAIASPALAAEFDRLAADGPVDVRIAALERAAALGQPGARERLREAAIRHHADAPPEIRIAVARAAGLLDADDRDLLSALLVDPDHRVRSAALDAVGAGDGHAVDAACSALADPATRRAAASAVGRLGDLVAPVVSAALDDPASDPDHVRRLVHASRLSSPVERSALEQRIAHPDRQTGLAVIESLVGPTPARGQVVETVDEIVALEELHLARIAHAIAAFAAEPSGAPVDDAVARALADERELVVRRLRALARLRFGDDQVGAALLALDDPRARRDIAVEALVVATGAHRASELVAMLDRSEVGRLPSALPPPPDAPADRREWLEELMVDGDSRWRSDWLRACALFTARRLGLPVDRARLAGTVGPCSAEVLAATIGPLPPPAPPLARLE